MTPQVQEFDWGRLTWLASRALGNSATMTLGRAIIKAGRENPVHRHPNCDEILHLLRGRIAHALGDDEVIMEPGDVIVIPAGTWHNARSMGDEAAEMVICFSSADRQTEFKGGA